MKLVYLIVPFALSMHTGQKAISQSGEDAFTVFCTGNQDSTGICLESNNPDEQKKLDCIMLPGNIIECKNKSKEKVECILIAATSAQAEFSCNKNNEVSIDFVSTTPIKEDIPSKIDNIEQDSTVESTNENPNATSIFTEAF